MSPQSGRYSAELRERAVRMVAEVRTKYPSEWAAIRVVASELGIHSPETLRRWVRQAESSVNASQKSTGSSKWHFLKKWLLRSHPIVIGVIIIVLGGLVFAYSQLVLGVNKQKPSLEVDQVGLSPANVSFPAYGPGSPGPSPIVTPFKIDIKLLNTGTQLAVINDARLVIQNFAEIPQCTANGNFPSTGNYSGNMPSDPRPGTVITFPVSQLVNPDGADRFDLLLSAPTLSGLALPTIYLYRVHVYLDYNTGTGPVDVGEILIALPFDPSDGDAYFWTHFLAAHPDYYYNIVDIERCLISNSHALNSILSLPGKRTTALSGIPPLLAFCCAGGSGGGAGRRA